MSIVIRALLGGSLVVAFALVAQLFRPVKLAGVFSAAPSVALASLAVTVAGDGPADARSACIGMIAGAFAFIVYGRLAPTAMLKLGPKRGTVAALGGWSVAAAALLPVCVVGAPASAAAAVGTAGAGRTRSAAAEQRPPVSARWHRLREATPRDLAIRFAFGALVSGIAGAVSLWAGPLLAGPLLAFPAVAVASLTLLADDKGAAAARDAARGAALGAVGLVAFAGTGAWAFDRLPTVTAFALVALAWAVVALSAYAAAWLTGSGADEHE